MYWEDKPEQLQPQKPMWLIWSGLHMVSVLVSLFKHEDKSHLTTSNKKQHSPHPQKTRRTESNRSFRISDRNTRTQTRR
ncbi:hypothetical protein Q5P01_017816 [Channa striata]|uniref:Uncharacterized protein n=1 Tax=Channa striata TaxID=64152 RepID=A0AA88MD27_CHASR|nr:hypothetical protein Q5P01_017816 [Channa striata]